jgi:hypothetical protein
MNGILGFTALLKRKITGDEQQYISVIEKRAIECLIS